MDVLQYATLKPFKRQKNYTKPSKPVREYGDQTDFWNRRVNTDREVKETRPDIIIKVKKSDIEHSRDLIVMYDSLTQSHAVDQSIETLHYNPERWVFDSRLCHWSTHLLTELSTRNISWG
jgi:hypothetical protein